jgi:hypothetical protein
VVVVIANAREVVVASKR